MKRAQWYSIDLIIPPPPIGVSAASINPQAARDYWLEQAESVGTPIGEPSIESFGLSTGELRFLATGLVIPRDQ